MKIQFLLPIAGIAGGVKVVYEYANYLQSRGHEVVIIYPGKLFPDTDSLKWKVEAIGRSLKYSIDKARGKNEGKTWFPLEAPLIHVPSLEAKYVQSADITIATSNETAEWAALLPERCGDKYYFLQHMETWSRETEKVEATWTLPLKKIVIASWLKDLAENKFKQKVYGVAPNGVDGHVFYNEHKEFNQPRRVLMLSHPAPWKGVPDGWKAIEIARQKYPDLVLRMFGTEEPEPGMPEGTEYFRKPTPEKLRELYQTSDIYLAPSWTEGQPLPPMEAMACGTAVLTTAVDAVRDYVIPDKTVLLSPPKEPEKLGQALLKLLDDENLLKSIAAEGQKHIQNFTIEKAAARFEEILLATVGKD